MSDRLWLTVRTPDGCYAWPVDDDPGRRDDQVHRARVLLGFPHGPGWILDRTSGWDIRIAPGQPHQQVGAEVRDVSELGGVDPAAVREWRDKDADARSADRLETARAVLASLTPAERQTLHADIPAGPGR